MLKRLIRGRLAPVILALALAGGAVVATALPALAQPGRPSIGQVLPPTAPGLSYNMTGKSGEYYNHGTVHAYNNPSNYSYRAEIFCVNGHNYFGSWTSTGYSEASCPSGTHGNVLDAQYDKTHQYMLYCWVPGLPAGGSC